MRSIKEIYKSNRNGIIFTLLFHIIILIVLIINTFRIKKEFVEPEIIFDFTEEILEPKVETKPQTEDASKISDQKTNIASNKSQTENSSEKLFDQEFEDAIKQAQELVNDVSNQLKKEIPTIEDLRMPVKTNTKQDSLINKAYSGDSNIEYYLENRYHISLPIPVYLSQYGGKVTVNIKVNRNGKVIEANPINNGNVDELLLSYAKTAAIRTIFNPSNEAPPLQTGTITYRFIAQ